MDPETPIYDRRLKVEEIRARIDGFYTPYHQALNTAVQQRYEEFGALWHLNLHSMPNDVYARLGMDPNLQLADFVLGDHDGKTCEPGIVDLIASYLQDHDYTVARNDPYKGVQLIAQIGEPAKRRSSLQIEIRRPVYMDEVTREPNDGFDRLQQDLTGLLQEVAQYVNSKV